MAAMHFASNRPLALVHVKDCEVMPTDRYTSAANEPTFFPSELSNREFLKWAHHATLRMLNIKFPVNASDAMKYRIIFKDGVPSPEWAAGLKFLLSMTTIGKRHEWPC